MPKRSGWTPANPLDLPTREELDELQALNWGPSLERAVAGAGIEVYHNPHPAVTAEGAERYAKQHAPERVAERARRKALQAERDAARLAREAAYQRDWEQRQQRARVSAEAAQRAARLEQQTRANRIAALAKQLQGEFDRGEVPGCTPPPRVTQPSTCVGKSAT